MKLRLALLLFIFSSSAFSWEVVKKKDEFYLVDSNKKSFAIISEGGVPSFIKVESFSPELNRIIYKSGVAGTSELKEIHRALLVTKKDMKVLGDFPVSYQSLTGNEGKVEVKWRLQKDRVIISDPETETTEKIQLR